MPNAPDPFLQRRRLTDAELDQLSAVTLGDVDAAVAAFNQHCPPEVKGLLDAKEEGK